MEIAEHIDILSEQGARLASTAERAGLDAPVPPCPQWRVKDLLRHTGYVHRWAARHLTERPAELLPGLPEAEILRGGAPDGELIGWFRDGHATLVKLLHSADPQLSTATFMPAPSPVAFWARRQAHETAMHRVDADAALALLGDDPGDTEFTVDFAADGIDELITGFGNRRRYRPATGGLYVHASDTGDAWHVREEVGRTAAARVSSAPVAACTVSGPAAAVYLFLWNRGPEVTVAGDRTVLDAWRQAVRVRWD